MLDKTLIQAYSRTFLEEDCVDKDITTNMLIESDSACSFKIISKEDAVIVSGLEFALQMFTSVTLNLTIDAAAKDGDLIKNNGIVLQGKAGIKGVLRAERTVLNILQHLSGISTKVNHLTNIVRNISPETRLLDTRKTMPGLRYLQKYAVYVGGGVNHRLNLSDGILIKDNHVAACGGFKNMLEKLKKSSIPSAVKLEIECDTLEQVILTLESGINTINVIMLDNFTIPEAKKAIALIMKANANFGYKKIYTEISGGINEGNICDYAALKPDYISLGSLTHTVKAVDLSLEID